jgi:serine/threonine protein kinase
MRAIKNNPVVKQGLLDEIEAMENLSGTQNIVNYVGVKDLGNYKYILIELCNGGSLEELCKYFKRIPERLAQRIFRQIIDAFMALREKDIFHRDVKLPNIMLHFPGHTGDPSDTYARQNYIKSTNMMTCPMEVKLADFGMARNM